MVFINLGRIMGKLMPKERVNTIILPLLTKYRSLISFIN